MEQHNRTIEQVVRVLGHEYSLNWLAAVPLTELTLNSAVNDSTQIFLAFITYG